MLNATLKHFLSILLIATLAGITGCSSPEEKRAQQLDEALELAEAGSSDEAIQLLETLSQEYPNDARILELMGQIYSMDEDYTMAAFFLEQAHLQDPGNVDLLYETYQAQDAAGQPAGTLLEKLARLSPETMTDPLWIQLGQYRAENNETEAALEAYLRGVNPEEEKIDPETAAAVGKLFAQLNNYAQASEWLTIAADNDSPAALTALFNLLQIQLKQKKWTAAEATIARLDKQFPGAVEASQWKQASQELKRWRAAQEAMKAKLAAEEAAKKKAAEKEKEDDVVVIDDEESSASAETAETSEEGEGEGKAQVVADLEAAEAMADKPAEEVASDETDQPDPNALAVDEEPSEGKTIEFDPSIAIEPADPDFSIEVSFDEQELAPETDISVETAENVIEEGEAVAIEPPVRPAEPAKTVEELLAEASTAEVDRNYKKAIRNYWAAIGKANNRADIWNLLSRAYLIDGQLQNADTTALEAVRLAPREVAYTLDFLRVAQRSRPPEEFLAQLETAYDRFPSSPEITLSLARAHERISKDKFVARNLYLRFIDIAPNHPLRSEAEAAAARLR